VPAGSRELVDFETAAPVLDRWITVEALDERVGVLADPMRVERTDGAEVLATRAAEIHVGRTRSPR
jgi:hypothetical protein